LEDGHEPVRYPLRRSIRSAFRVITQAALNTEILTPPPLVLTAPFFWLLFFGKTKKSNRRPAQGRR
ncbi:hypothetical protein, partial [Burkholderia multivorans]|uniref:hypothetical protein n=1 Tax=Burkholderia multivorans TaxID=87883 RepID=UPI001C6160E0